MDWHPIASHCRPFFESAARVPLGLAIARQSLDGVFQLKQMFTIAGFARRVP